jgi:hypothetical protein
VFVIQASAADVRDGLRYSRNYYWSKDLNVPVSNAKPRADDILVVVDVDYYIDMVELLAESNQPVLLYTFQPGAVAQDTGEFAFQFDCANVVHYNVSGGASYEHKVWNYGVDCLMVSNWFSTRAYHVERRKANPHHEYVLLIPTGIWYYGYSWFVRCLRSDQLKYLSVNHGHFNVMDVKTSDGIMRSLARVGEYNCATVPISKFEAIVAVARSTKTEVGNATVQSWLENDRSAAAVIVDYLRVISKSWQARPVFVYPASEGVRTYQVLSRLDLYEQAEPLMVSFMSAIYPGAFVPDASVANEQAAVTGRLLKPQVDALKMEAGVDKAMSKFLLTEMEVFVELLVPTPHVFIPYDVDEVYERQSRPAQRALLEQADSARPSRFCKTFLKKECYQKVTDPRIITTFNTVDKREYARFIYVLSDEIAKYEWYTFGKTPRFIASAVAEICRRSAYGVCCADAARMEGHISSRPRLLERMILLRFFAKSYHTKLIDLHGSQSGVKARTVKGFLYTLDYQRGSGSGETALFNGLLSKFIDYLARRLAGVLPGPAFRALGQFGGDDSIVTEISPFGIEGHFLVRAGAMVGQEIENVEFKRGAEDVNYLARLYTEDVWNGDEQSHCDLPRSLCKLHVTANLTQFTPLAKLQQKLAGLWYTDRHTPIIQEILDAAERVGMKFGDLVLDRRIVSWWGKYKESEQWPNHGFGPTHDFCAKYMPKANINPLLEYLERVSSCEQLLSMPPLVLIDDLPPNNKLLVVVDDSVVQPPYCPTTPTVLPPSAPVVFVVGTKAAVDDRPICKSFVQGKCLRKACRFRHMKICKEFAAGVCKRASKCKFPHIKL